MANYRQKGREANNDQRKLMDCNALHDQIKRDFPMWFPEVNMNEALIP